MEHTNNTLAGHLMEIGRKLENLEQTGFSSEYSKKKKDELFKVLVIDAFELQNIIDRFEFESVEIDPDIKNNIDTRIQKFIELYQEAIDLMIAHCKTDEPIEIAHLENLLNTAEFECQSVYSEINDIMTGLEMETPRG